MRGRQVPVKGTKVIDYIKNLSDDRTFLVNFRLDDIKPVTDRDDLMIITNKGQVIRTKISGISLLGRNTQGVRLINLKGEEKVVSVKKIVDPEDNEITGEEEENS